VLESRPDQEAAADSGLLVWLVRQCRAERKAHVRAVEGKLD
jgi:hypothetical protein